LTKLQTVKRWERFETQCIARISYVYDCTRIDKRHGVQF